MEARGPMIRRATYSPPASGAGFNPSRKFSSQAAPAFSHAQAGTAHGDDGSHAICSARPDSAICAASRPLDPPARGRSSVLDEISGLIGHEAATRLVAAFGGTRIYVPQFPEPDDTLSDSIGYHAALTLAQMYGGDRIEVPNPPPRRVKIIELRAGGLSVDAIARSLGCTRRRVFQVLAEAREPKRPG